MNKNSYSIEQIKALGKDKSDENLDILLKMYGENLPVDIKREVVSSIGRQKDLDRVFLFIQDNVFNKLIIMEYVYQMFRTCLYRSKIDERFDDLRDRIMKFYNNEVINKMSEFYEYKKNRNRRHTNVIKKPLLLVGDASVTLSNLPENSIQLAFTSPPYYNARIYSDYHSYDEYLQKMKEVFIQCNRVIEEGRFFIVNVSPVITKRPGREFESIRYPIHYDFHSILEDSGFYFMDEIIWIKPEPSVPNRIGGYLQTRKALSYKPNCITESLMIYRKKCSFLLDKNINDYIEYDEFLDEDIDISNCWYITPKSDKDHPAVFPEELCRRVLKYYSFKSDVVLDPFAGSGTLGRVASKMERIPVMCELEDSYIKLISENGVNYEIRR